MRYPSKTMALLTELEAASRETNTARRDLARARQQEQRIIGRLWRMGVPRPELYKRSSYSPAQVWRFTP